MDEFAYDVALTATKISAHKAKAVADAFASEYIDKTNYHLTALSIETNPDNFVYLFAAMHDALCDVCNGVDDLVADHLSAKAPH